MQQIRPFEPADEDLVAEVWHRSGQAEYTYLPTWQAFTLDKARTVFRKYILPECELWVGIESGHIVAYLAMNGSTVDRLYVDPPAQGKGWGSRLIEFAKKLNPEGLELYTHQANTRARALYERDGFVAVRFGISPPPESAPDVEYHWRPNSDAA